jgi:hypothetical protein
MLVWLEVQLIKTQSSAATSEQQHLLKTATKSSFRSILCNDGVHLVISRRMHLFSASNSLCSLRYGPEINIYRLRYNP